MGTVAPARPNLNRTLEDIIEPAVIARSCACARRYTSDDDRTGSAAEAHDDTGNPLRPHAGPLPRFRDRQGRYLFMPSLRALRFLATLPPVTVVSARNPLMLLPPGPVELPRSAPASSIFRRRCARHGSADNRRRTSGHIQCCVVVVTEHVAVTSAVFRVTTDDHAFLVDSQRGR